MNEPSINYNNSLEEPSSFSEDLRGYLALAWHWAWLLILAAVIAGAASYYYSQRQTRVYQAKATYLIDRPSVYGWDDYSNLMTSSMLAETYSQMMVKTPVLRGVVDRLGLDIAPESLAGKVSVAPVQDTQLLVVSVRDTNPFRAADIANTIGAIFAEQNRELQTYRYSESKSNLETQMARIDEQIKSVTLDIEDLGDGEKDQEARDQLEFMLAEYRSTYGSLLQSYENIRVTEAQSASNLVQIEAAQPNLAPISPQVMRNTMMAAAVGFMVAAGLVFLLEALDDTLHEPGQISAMGIPILGLIASHTNKSSKPISASEPRSPVAEAFRLLRTNLQFSSVDHPLRTLLVTSPSPEDGKSTVTSNLGVILAQGGHRVIVLDADLRRPRVHKLLDLSNEEGMSQMFVEQQLVLNGQVQNTSIERLQAVTSGGMPPNPAELLGSDKMGVILDKLLQQADMVVIDSPPVLAVTDASILATRVDGVVLVVKPGSTRMGAFKQAVDQLNRVGANLVGVVMNDVSIRRSRYRYSYYKSYYYTYYNYYRSEDGTRKPRHKKSEAVPNGTPLE